MYTNELHKVPEFIKIDFGRRMYFITFPGNIQRFIKPEKDKSDERSDNEEQEVENENEILSIPSKK